MINKWTNKLESTTLCADKARCYASPLWSNGNTADKSFSWFAKQHATKDDYPASYQPNLSWQSKLKSRISFPAWLRLWRKKSELSRSVIESRQKGQDMTSNLIFITITNYCSCIRKQICLTDCTLKASFFDFFFSRLICFCVILFSIYVVFTNEERDI